MRELSFSSHPNESGSVSRRLLVRLSVCSCFSFPKFVGSEFNLFAAIERLARFQSESKSLGNPVRRLLLRLIVKYVVVHAL